MCILGLWNVSLGVPFGYGFNEEVRKFLEDFRDMVNFCIDYAYRRGITSYARLGKGVYGGWEGEMGLFYPFLPLL
jgi:putative transposase